MGGVNGHMYIADAYACVCVAWWRRTERVEHHFADAAHGLVALDERVRQAGVGRSLVALVHPAGHGAGAGAGALGPFQGARGEQQLAAFVA